MAAANRGARKRGTGCAEREGGTATIGTVCWEGVDWEPGLGCPPGGLLSGSREPRDVQAAARWRTTRPRQCCSEAGHPRLAGLYPALEVMSVGCVSPIASPGCAVDFRTRYWPTPPGEPAPTSAAAEGWRLGPAMDPRILTAGCHVIWFNPARAGHCGSGCRVSLGLSGWPDWPGPHPGGCFGAVRRDTSRRLTGLQGMSTL